MARARVGSALPFRLIAAFVIAAFIGGVATAAYSVPPSGMRGEAAPIAESIAGARAGVAAQQATAGTAEISGVKYHDRDYDGTMESGEEGLAGWTIILSSASRPGWQATVTTGADGTFAFTGLVASTYAITEIERSGWHNTNGLPHFVTVAAGEIASSGNEIGSVQDRVELTLTRSASCTTYRRAGDVITFTYTVRNTGNIGFLPPFSITDDKVAVTFPAIEMLVPGAEVSFSIDYTVTQADVDAGFMTSTAVAHVDNFAHSAASTLSFSADDPADTDLLISASHYGRRRHQKVTVYTRLKAEGGVPLADGEVLFQVKRPGSTSWTTVATRTVDPATGKARYLAQLNMRGTYQWRTRFLGTPLLESTTSRTIRVKVSR